MLGAGIEIAEEGHLVALGRSGAGIGELGRVDHTPSALEAPGTRIASSSGTASFGGVRSAETTRVANRHRALQRAA